MEYIDLVNEAYKENIEIVEMNFNDNIKGLYCDNIIGLNKNIETATERKCILAEELGHFYTSSGNIINNSILCKKSENTARRWAYKRLITLNDFIDAFNYGINTLDDLANYLDVTLPFLKETINFYNRKYGVRAVLDDYIIFFEPCFSIMKNF